MSYGFKVTVKDGLPEIDTRGATLPEGVWEVFGHIPTELTWQGESLGVMRMVFDEESGYQTVKSKAESTYIL